MNEEITPEFPEGKDNYCPRCYFEADETILRSECPHSSPAKGCSVEDCTRENGHVGFHIWGRDTVSPAKDQTECCDGECNHDACCGKIPENCTHSTESVSGEEWEAEFDKKFYSGDGSLKTDTVNRPYVIKSFIRTLLKKEYERGREDRGEALGTISLDDFRKQTRNDTLDEIVELVKKYWTFDDGQRHTHSWHSRADFLEEVNRLKANRDI